MSVTSRSRMCHRSSEPSATSSANASNLLNLHQVGDQAGVEYVSQLAASVELGDLEQTRGRMGEMEVSWRRRGPLEKEDQARGFRRIKVFPHLIC